MHDESNEKDVTEAIARELRHGHTVPIQLRQMKSMDKLTPAGRRVLAEWSGVRLGYVSRALVYDQRIRRHIDRRDHKTLIRLVFGGHLRVVRVARPLPGDHPPSRVGAHEPYHYELRARS
jgi:hypothetical protein